MPDDDVVRLATDRVVGDLAADFGVSTPAMAWRLYNAGHGERPETPA